MRSFEGDPLNGPEVDAVVFLQKTSNPRAGCLRVGADSNPAAVQISRIHTTALRIKKNRVMLPARHSHCRQQNIRLAIRPGLQKSNNGKLAQIESLLSHESFEHLVYGLDVSKIK